MHVTTVCHLVVLLHQEAFPCMSHVRCSEEVLEDHAMLAAARDMSLTDKIINKSYSAHTACYVCKSCLACSLF